METTDKKQKGRNKFKTNILQQDLQPTCSFWYRAAAIRDASFVSLNCYTAAEDRKQPQLDVSERKQPIKPGDMFWWLTEEEAEMFLYLESHNQHPIQFPLPVRTTEKPQHTVAPKKLHPAVKVLLLGQVDDHIIRLKTEQVLSEVEHLKEMFQTQTALNAEAELKHGTRIKIPQLQITDRKSTESTVKKLEEDLGKKDCKKDVETSQARLWEEKSRLVAALVQEEDNLEEILQWEEEESRHLKQQALEQKTSSEIEKPEQQSLWKRFLQLFK